MCIRDRMKSAVASPSFFLARSTASVYLVIIMESSPCEYLVSGSLVNLPIKITLFIFSYHTFHGACPTLQAVSADNTPPFYLSLIHIYSLDFFPATPVAGTILAYSLNPVSYTHLDVYKRQGVRSGRLRACPDRGAARSVCDVHSVAEQLSNDLSVRSPAAACACAGEFKPRLLEL